MLNLKFDRMTQKDTICRFNVEAFINKNEPDKCFYELNVVTDEKNQKKDVWNPITVGNVWITDGPKEFQIHITISGREEKPLVFPISEEQYKKFQSYKGDKRRLNLIAKATKGKLSYRNMRKSEMLVVRMTPYRMRKFEEAADRSNLSTSAYARQLLEGKEPKAALTDKEAADMQELVKLRADMLYFYDAVKGELAKIPRDQRTSFIVLGMPYQQFRDYIRAALIKLDKMIGDEYSEEKLLELYKKSHGGDKK